MSREVEALAILSSENGRLRAEAYKLRERVGALEAAARKAYSGFAALSELDKLGRTPPRISEVAERHCDRLRAALEDNDA